MQSVLPVRIKMLSCALGTLVALCVCPLVMAQPVVTMTSGLALDRFQNLVQNGSFENGLPGSPKEAYYIDPNTTTPGYPSTNNQTYLAIPNWTVSGGGASTYADWGTATTTYKTSTQYRPGVPYLDASGNSSASAYGVYLGNNLVNSSLTPSIATNGVVTFGGTPTFTNIASGYGDTNSPVQIAQTINNLTAGQTYCLSFWASGEEAGAPIGVSDYYGGDGIFRFDLTDATGTFSQYLAAPSGVANTVFLDSNNQPITSHLYQYTFVPSSSSVTVALNNWGHVKNPALGFDRTEVALDDFIVNLKGGAAIPEPSTLVLLAMGSFVCLKHRRRK